MHNIEIPTRKRNRYLSKLPKRGFFWCNKCDRSLVADGARCCACGAQNGKRRNRPRDVAVK